MAVKVASISEEDHSAMLASLSEEIQKFDTFFNEKSHDLSPYDVRQTQVISVQIKEKFVALQDTLKPKKKFGFKSKYKKVCDHYIAYNQSPTYIILHIFDRLWPKQYYLFSECV